MSALRKDAQSADVVGLPQRRVIECAEWEDLQLAAEELVVGNVLQVYGGIAASTHLRTRISGSQFTFTSTNFVGHIPLNDRVALNVTPRFTVSNLIRVLRIAGHSPVPLEQFPRSYTKSKEALPSILDQLIDAFVHALDAVVQNGLLRRYVREEVSTSYPRGRILFEKTVRQHLFRGRRFSCAATWFSPSADVPENRLLKYSLWLLHARLAAGTPRRGVARLRTQLNRLYRVFDGVRLDVARSFMLDSNVLNQRNIPAVRSYYTPAVQLALLLIKDEGIDLEAGTGAIRVPSLLINLQDAFEAYLRNVLVRRTAEEGVQWGVLDGNRAPPEGARKGLFDEQGSRPATPDIVVRYDVADERAETIIVEVKYKGSIDREDINQAIVYALSYRCRIAVLAHVSVPPQQPGLRLEGSLNGIKIYAYAFDLAAPLDAEEAAFVRALEGLGS